MSDSVQKDQGQRKLRRCKMCRTRLTEGSPPWVVWCSEECGTKLALLLLEKRKAADQRAWQRRANKALRESAKKASKQKREFKQNDYRHQFKLTLEAAKALCRVLDAGQPCISCGTVADIQYAAGHYKSVGAHPELSLDLRNLHRQCNRYCNCGLSGNIAGTKTTHGFRAGLIQRYGAALVDYLDGYHAPRKYTCPELIELRKAYKAEIRRIENGEAPSRQWRAL